MAKLLFLLEIIVVLLRYGALGQNPDPRKLQRISIERLLFVLFHLFDTFTHVQITMLRFANFEAFQHNSKFDSSNSQLTAISWSKQVDKQPKLSMSNLHPQIVMLLSATILWT